MDGGELLPQLGEATKALICLVNAANPAPADCLGSGGCNVFQAAVSGRRKLFLLICF